MSKSIEQSIERVIVAMHANLGERITIDDMARIAMFSKFHFSRAFRDLTGMSPGRFLSALRLQAAKHLLVSTSLSVAEISNQVGYSSVGTFSWRFKSSVGVAPTAFRAYGGQNPGTQDRRRTSSHEGSATIRGVVSAPVPHQDTPVFVGLFPDVLPQGSPLRCAFLDEPGRYVLDHVPPGTWHVLAYSAQPSQEAQEGGTEPGAHNTLVGAHGPLTVSVGTVLTAVDLRLRPARRTDPPVLVGPAGRTRGDIHERELVLQ